MWVMTSVPEGYDARIFGASYDVAALRIGPCLRVQHAVHGLAAADHPNSKGLPDINRHVHLRDLDPHFLSRMGDPRFSSRMGIYDVGSNVC